MSRLNLVPRLHHRCINGRSIHRNAVIASAALMVLWLGFAPSIADACNIPVFRYALERWKPDACEIIVFHDGNLSADQGRIIDEWTAGSVENHGTANAKVWNLDVTSSLERDRIELWQGLSDQSDATLPHVLVRTKLGQGQFVNHWHGSIRDAESLGIFDSPARSEIRDRLIAGHSVVWLLIGGKDPAATKQAKELAEDTFKTLKSKVQLPEGIGLPGSELYADVPLVLKFSLLEIDPADVKERFLIGLLSGLRSQAVADGQPLLVPVFGRGRALEVLPASDVSPQLIEELTIFLSGACSCQVKEQNPGFDLLIDANWELELFGEEANRPPDRSDQEGQNRNPVLLQIPRGRN